MNERRKRPFNALARPRFRRLRRRLRVQYSRAKANPFVGPLPAKDSRRRTFKSSLNKLSKNESVPRLHSSAGVSSGSPPNGPDFNNFLRNARGVCVGACMYACTYAAFKSRLIVGAMVRESVFFLMMCGVTPRLFE